MDYSQSLEYLSTIVPKNNSAINSLNLRRITYLLELMDNPQEEFKSIHIVGTSGKGSVATICQKILSSSTNFKVGLHISPHIQVPNERMQIADKFASKKEFANLTQEISENASRVNKKLGLGNPTYFEATLAMTFRHFEKNKTEFAVIESGLGGKLDATNVLNPCVLVITNVSLDHTRILGPTITSIANQESEAIKGNVPVITACKNKSLSIVKNHCSNLKSPLYEFGNRFGLLGPVISNKSGSKFVYRGINFSDLPIDLKLIGPIQSINFALASAATEIAYPSLKPKSLEIASKKIFIPARFEVVQKKSPFVVLDGSHNIAKINEFIKSLSLFDEEKTGIFAIAKGKQAKAISRIIAPKFKKLYVCEMKRKRKFYSTKTLNKYLPSSICEENPISALNHALLENPSMIVATGSFHLAGVLRQRYLSNEEALRKQSLKF